MSEKPNASETLRDRIKVVDPDGTTATIDIVEVNECTSFWDTVKSDIKSNPVWKCIIGMVIFCLLELLLAPGGLIVPEGVKLPKLLASIGWAICAFSWFTFEIKRILKSI